MHTGAPAVGTAAGTAVGTAVGTGAPAAGRGTVAAAAAGGTEEVGAHTVAVAVAVAEEGTGTGGPLQGEEGSHTGAAAAQGGTRERLERVRERVQVRLEPVRYWRTQIAVAVCGACNTRVRWEPHSQKTTTKSNNNSNNNDRNTFPLKDRGGTSKVMVEEAETATKGM